MKELAACFQDVGDEPRAAVIAQAIEVRRAIKPWERTGELRALIAEAAPVQLLTGPARTA